MALGQGFEVEYRIIKSLLKADVGQTDIVVHRRFKHLAEEIQSIFESQPDVNVIVDRRCQQRRARNNGIKKERRRADRRQSKEKLVDVVITVRAGS